MKQRFSKRTRLVSALLTLAMVFTFLPFSAFAANTEIDFNSPDFQLDFPDAEFQRFLKERCDTNHNGKLDAQELSITEMTITDDYKIKNLEGIRFFDLVRWGVADEVINAYIAKEKVFRSHLQNAHFVKGKHEYFPIPQSMIDICGTEVMKQNPGY